MIKENLKSVLDSIPSSVQLVAVSKTKPQEMILEAYDAGYRIFGENRALELREKAEALPKDIQWHAIGHLQRNKVKYIAPHVALIHSVDSFRLLEEINNQAIKNNRVIRCLLQFHIAEETSKFGLNLEEALTLIKDAEDHKLENIEIVGVMGMASFVQDKKQVQSEFRILKSIFDQLKKEVYSTADEFQVISMGMSGDYQIAIKEGSNMIRVGSSIFGSRK